MSLHFVKQGKMKSFKTSESHTIINMWHCENIMGLDLKTGFSISLPDLTGI